MKQLFFLPLLLALLTSISANAADEYYYVRPTGDAISWAAQAAIDPTRVITITDISELTPGLGMNKVFCLAKGTYTAKLFDETPLSFYYLQLANGEKVYGGFSGTETSINLVARVLTDRDENGITEPWEFLNETVIDGQAGTNLGTHSKRLIGIENGGEVNGLSLKNFSFGSVANPVTIAAGGPIFVGSFLKTNNAGVAAAPLGYDATTSGSLINCSVINVSSFSPQTAHGGQGGAAIISNVNSVINNCLFEQCQSNTFNSSMGGAVYVLGNGGKISNSIFRNNLAYFTNTSGTLSRGGAVYAEAYAASDMNCTIENSVFFNNSAFGKQALKGYGAAFRSDAVAGKRGAQILNCTFSNNYNSSTALASGNSGNIELINTGVMVNCVNHGGSNGFRANTANANYYLQSLVSTVANLDMAASSSYSSILFDATLDLGFTRPTTFSGAIFPDALDYETKAAEIRKANYSVSKVGSFLETNYGVATLDLNYNSAVPAATIDITATLPTKDIAGRARNLSKNILGAYTFGIISAVSEHVIDNGAIYGADKSIFINNCIGKTVTIYSIGGLQTQKTVATSDKFVIPMTKGLYIVKAGAKATKVLVN